ncbi:MAG: transglutaminase domain-containing protein [Clostridium sp.]|uniref:transglutaminase domain-containing protein n=1 Tax=Clostridium sp. TaxID=1506 RepID=UPI003F311E54
MKKKFLTALISGLLILNLVACGGNNNEASTTSSNSSINVEELKTKYSANEKVTYKDPIYNVSRNHTFEIPMKKEVYEKHKDTIKEKIYVSLDSEMKMKVNSVLTFDEKNNVLKVEAPNLPVLYNNEDYNESRTDLNVKDFEVETSRENEKDWGNGNNYYLCNTLNLETGDTLPKPELTLFTIKSELNTPTIQFYLSPEGKAGFKWNEVPGANKYIIYSIIEDPKSNFYSLSEVASTKKTNFEDFVGSVVDFDGMVVSTNSDFNVSEKKSIRKFCVMAVAEDKKSLISNIINPVDVAKNVPISVHHEKNKELDKGDALVDFPTHLYVKMGDGSAVLTPLDFDTNYVEFKEHDKHGLIAVIRYKYRGTSLVSEHYIKVDKKDDATKKEALDVLKTLQERQKKIQWNGLNSDVDVNIESTPPSDLPEDKSEAKEDTKVSSENEKVYASSALSEYIALNLLDGNEKVNVSKFPESSNKDLLIDCFFEALYQNPLAMTVKAVGYDYSSKELVVQYGQTKEEQKKLQKEVKDEVQKVAKEIIKDDMTPIEKEFAINKYLCDTAEYDFAALENAKENDMQVDAKFNDSFTPYGVLVKKVGVCASYAGSFKLLADAAGLESIVVTGNLNGNLPHAWNRVLIDGQWMTLDSTNNDNEDIPNALLNLSDKDAKEVLVEDDQYVLNTKLPEFKGTKSEFEYYRVSGKYHSKDKVASALAKELEKNNEVYIRTDTNISDQDASKIVQDACKKAKVKPKDARLWLGVIYVKK